MVILQVYTIIATVFVIFLAITLDLYFEFKSISAKTGVQPAFKLLLRPK